MGPTDGSVRFGCWYSRAAGHRNRPLKLLTIEGEGRISQIQKRFHKSRNAGRKTVTNPETLPQIQKRWGVVGTNPETNHKSRNVGRVSATNPEAQTQKVLFCSWPPDLLTSPKSHAGIPKTSHTLGGPIREKGSLRGIRIRLGGPEVERFLVL